MHALRLGSVLLIAASFAACAHESDVEIRNPITAGGTVDAHRIVKPHEYVERQRGLPAGAVADEAQLMSIDPQQICFGVTMHELDPIDLREAEPQLVAAGAPAVESARVEPQPTTFRAYEGLVADRRQVGMETSCSRRDGNGVCVAWDTHPTYQTFMIPGTVNVYEARGRVCFDNRSLVTTTTRQLSLELKLPRRAGAVEPAAVVGGWGMFGQGAKRVIFRWGFSGGAKGGGKG